MILVCAATGRIGKRVLDTLVQDNSQTPVICGARNIEAAQKAKPKCDEIRKVDYDDPDSMTAAFAGVDRIVFIPSYADTEQRAQQGYNLISAAEAAGVKQVIFISIMDTRSESPLPFAHAYGAIEDRLKSSALDWTILRTSMYTDNLAEQYPMWLQKAELITCAGNGKISYVSRDDITRSIVGVLTSPIQDHAKITYTLTGPAALSYEAVAEIVEELFQTKLTVTHVEREEFATRLFEIWGVAYEGIEHVARVTPMFQAVFKQGMMQMVTNHVQKLTGQEPESVKDWLSRHK